MSDLKKIYVADGSGDAHVLRGLLEMEGITTVIRGDDMLPLQGGSLFHLETRPSVWVIADDTGRYARAVEVANEYVARKNASSDTTDEPWCCPACGETVEAQFTACWSCGEEPDSQS